MKDTLSELYDIVLSRKAEKTEGSYTCYLFEKGLDKSFYIPSSEAKALRSVPAVLPAKNS